MIAVKIPAAIRACSPVVCVSEPSVGSDVVGSRGVVKSTEDGEVNVSGWWTPRACWALIISDPTGAAHLAWWLRAHVPAHRGEHVRTLHEMRWSPLDFHSALDGAACGLPADLARLADYAHRVAGVSS